MEVGSSSLQKGSAASGIQRKSLDGALSSASLDQKDAYVYEPLTQNDKFRLVSLLPGRGSRKLRCSLSVYPVAEAPAYEALSYEWGEPRMSYRMHCDGKVILITPTLEVALRQLRRRRKCRLLWIDQLCINQQDREERGHQVNIMKTIYERAARVVMWLGPADSKHAAVAFEFIREIFRCNPTYIPWQGAKFPSDQDLSLRGLPPRSSTEWEALVYMCNLPYFTRVWVVQELMVASEALMMWGEFEIGWSIFRTVLDWLLSNRCYLRDSQGRPGFNIKYTQYMLALRETDTLIDWLDITSGKEAADPRDRVFAVLGLAREVLQDLPRIMEADYHKSEADVYRDVARYCIRKHKNLGVLSRTRHPTTPLSGEFSTWAPGHDLSRLTNRGFNASRETIASPQNTGDPGLLPLEGAKIDEVEASCVRLGPNESIEGKFSIPIIDAWRCATEKLDDPYPGGPHKSLLSNFVMTLIPCTYYPSRAGLSRTIATEDRVLAFASYVTQDSMAFLTKHSVLEQLNGCPRDLLQCVEKVVALGKALSPQLRADAPILPEATQWCGEMADICHPHSKSASGAAAAYLESMILCPGDGKMFGDSYKIFAWNRTFYTTKNGLMGIGPPTMQEGDIICVLFGGEVPYVLRPIAGGEYQFIGDCYIQHEGFMDGAAIDKLEDGELTAEWFPLR